MSVRIGINGFGRMGRLAMRAASGNRQIEIVHINELRGGPETAAHLLEFDSVHGRWPAAIAAEPNSLAVNGARIGFSAFGAPDEAPWDAAGVEIVLECTGKFLTAETLAPYFERGVRKVIVAAPVKRGALNIVMGVNDRLYDPERHHIVTAASCTTNCLAPVVKVVHERFGIRHGVITTIHDVTNTQTVVDLAHKDLRRARSALMSLVPTTTGSATAIGLIYPELQGKLNGMAVRVPLLNASLTDCVFEVARPVTAAEVNARLREAAQDELRGILGFEERPLVSVDFVNDPRSSIVDGPSTMVVDDTQLKVIAWYDNEWGYVNRLVELAAKVADTMPSTLRKAAAI
ncbi:MAG TPA: ArsJ-associated glyceraldehyde-3-phosphate dehydrogenase [Candidatus Binataceae bacterium]|jgi:glyceraldehyde 3-phosphate dehydrogenase